MQTLPEETILAEYRNEGEVSYSCLVEVAGLHGAPNVVSADGGYK